jgi:hypothetical protein
MVPSKADLLEVNILDDNLLGIVSEAVVEDENLTVCPSAVEKKDALAG